MVTVTILAFCLAASAVGQNKPSMSLMESGCADLVKPSKLDMDGDFTISIDVRGSAGFTYACNTTYDTTADATDKDCADWLPSDLVDRQEDLGIKIEAFDSKGDRAVCMQWKLDFSGAKPKGSWYPDAPVLCGGNAVLSDPDTEGPKYFDFLAREWPAFGNVTNGGQVTEENTAAARNAVNEAYLDSMTHLSHACVPTSVRDTLYPPLVSGPGPVQNPSEQVVGGFFAAFPPGVQDPMLMRVSHKALAVTSLIHSIDRQCADGWNARNSESCVNYPYLHCHSICSMTWNFAPGGITSWAMHHLNHHLPSPGINAVQHRRLKDAPTFGNLGCGGNVLV